MFGSFIDIYPRSKHPVETYDGLMLSGGIFLAYSSGTNMFNLYLFLQCDDFSLNILVPMGREKEVLCAFPAFYRLPSVLSIESTMMIQHRFLELCNPGDLNSNWYLNWLNKHARKKEKTLILCIHRVTQLICPKICLFIDWELKRSSEVI